MDRRKPRQPATYFAQVPVELAKALAGERASREGDDMPANVSFEPAFKKTEPYSLQPPPPGKTR